MSHTIVLTKIMEFAVILSNEEYEEMKGDLLELFEDFSCGDFVEVERTAEEI